MRMLPLLSSLALSIICDRGAEGCRVHHPEGGVPAPVCSLAQRSEWLLRESELWMPHTGGAMARRRCAEPVRRLAMAERRGYSCGYMGVPC